MLKINIVCVGKVKEKYFADAIAEYSKRLTAFCKLQIIELNEERIMNNNPNPSQIEQVLEAEGRRISQKL
ncbi:MAG TPA: 23S rRNA (pseudouridine(1915)-N(3))-methyltransferase RlmH, partial [Ruminococcaceae bacterium]|nr:23S rRNA (pseudouridine(1915)-N(3))-methyltransferase RlmH [Oscillospiraceae bacterium]